MGFEDRTQTGQELVKSIEQAVWQPLTSRGIFTVPYGYENHIEGKIRRLLRYNRIPTARHIRFTPDYFVLDQNKATQNPQDPDSVYLLEYKVTQTPLYSSQRIHLLRAESADPSLNWPDIGQMEKDAYDNYINLHNAHIRVVILNYCAYHARPLLCDFVERITLLHRDTVGIRGSGSGTPFVNFDCRSMRSLEVFLADEHNVGMSRAEYEKLCSDLQKSIPVTHNRNSPHHSGNKK